MNYLLKYSIRDGENEYEEFTILVTDKKIQVTHYRATAISGV